MIGYSIVYDSAPSALLHLIKKETHHEKLRKKHLEEILKEISNSYNDTIR